MKAKTKTKTKTKSKSPAAAKAVKPAGKGPSPKAATAAKPGKGKASAKPVQPEAARERIKLVRDSFTMPRDDFELIDLLKARAIEFKRPAKKSELLRAGLQVLARLQDAELLAALETLRPLKAGRPKNRH